MTRAKANNINVPEQPIHQLRVTAQTSINKVVVAWIITEDVHGFVNEIGRP